MDYGPRTDAGYLLAPSDGIRFGSPTLVSTAYPQAPMNIRDLKDSLLVTNADLSRSSFNDVSLHEAKFTDVNLSRTIFADINLSDATFKDVNLSNVEIDNCDLTGMKIQGVLVSELIRAYGRRA
jgi:uncharacterized protein YjbI with pentapeptide repeats